MAQEVQQESMGGYPEMGASKGGGLKTIGLPVILSVLAVVGLAFMGFLPGSAPNYIANTQALNTKIDDNASEIASMRSAVADASANASQASADIASVRKDITAVQSSVSGFASQSNLNALKQELDTLKSSSSSGVTKAQYDALQTKVDLLSTQIIEAQKKISDLQNGTGGVDGIATGQVSLVVKNNIWDTPIVGFDEIIANGTQNRSFTVDVNNGSGKTIKNMQFAIGLQLMDDNGNPYTLPTGTDIKVSSPDLFTTWQRDIVGSQIAFRSSPSTDYWMVSQPVGITSYEFRITITTGANPIPPIRVVYGAKLVKYE
jgi:hypothetical protein